MANSPLLTMPLLNGITTFDTGDPSKPNPSNIFGNIAYGFRTEWDDVPPNFFVLSRRYTSDMIFSATTAGAYGWSSPNYLQGIDFNNIWTADLGVRKAIVIPNGFGSGMRFASICLGRTGFTCGDYISKLPDIPKGYAEVAPNYSYWVEAKKKYMPYTLWRIQYGTNYHNKVLIVNRAYSRFPNGNKIKAFLMLEGAEIPIVSGLGTGNYYYGFAESPELVPVLWGANVYNPVVNALGIINFDDYFAILYYYYGVDNLTKLKNFMLNTLIPAMKGNGQPGGFVNNYNTPKELDNPILFYGGWHSSAEYYNNVKLTKLRQDWDYYVNNYSIFSRVAIWANVTRAELTGSCDLCGSNCAADYSRDGCISAVIQNVYYTQNFCLLLALLLYLFYSDECLLKNKNDPNDLGEFYIDLHKLWSSFKNDGIYNLNKIKKPT